MQKVVIGLSGGMDSTTLLGILLGQGLEVHCCMFYYGSKHGRWENEAAVNVLKYYDMDRYVALLNLNHSIKYYKFNLLNIFDHFSSNLLLSGGEIPSGHYAAETMKKTVVPGRNTIFASVMAGLAESIGAEAIALGVHSGDHHIYPDCRPEYIQSLNATIQLATDRKVQVITPLINDDKTSILEKGYSLEIPVPYHLTRTCYRDQPLACGKCGSCVERLEAFSNLNIKDPVEYE